MDTVFTNVRRLDEVSSASSKCQTNRTSRLFRETGETGEAGEAGEARRTSIPNNIPNFDFRISIFAVRDCRSIQNVEWCLI
jgi:hypothetical protein